MLWSALHLTCVTIKWNVHIFLCIMWPKCRLGTQYEKKQKSSMSMNKGRSFRQIREKSATLCWKLMHLYLPCFSFRVCSSTVALRLAAWHVLACLNRTSKDTGPWRIESWGHELHSYPHKDKPSVSAPLKTDKESGVEILWSAKGWGNQMPIDFNASSVRNDFLRQNGWRLEKWVLKPGLWEIKGP